MSSVESDARLIDMVMLGGAGCLRGVREPSYLGKSNARPHGSTCGLRMLDCLLGKWMFDLLEIATKVSVKVHSRSV